MRRYKSGQGVETRRDMERVATVEEVEDVPGNDGSEDHAAPVLREALDAKGLGDEARVDAEEEAVGHCHPVSL